MTHRYFSLIASAEGSERDAARECPGTAYEDHQFLWRLFAAPRGTAREFLFRRVNDDGVPRFYVVSEGEPKAPSSAWQVRTQIYAPRLAVGMRLSFVLRANPTISNQSSSGRTFRHDAVMHEKTRLLRERGLTRWSDWTSEDRPSLTAVVQRACGAWLLARASRLGVSIPETALAVEGYARHRVRLEERGDLRFSSVDFIGECLITDAALLLQALYKGVGRAKAFGCGLMLVRNSD